eukprot:3594132-Rhodomonas_salina.1
MQTSITNVGRFSTYALAEAIFSLHLGQELEFAGGATKCPSGTACRIGRKIFVLALGVCIGGGVVVDSLAHRLDADVRCFKLLHVRVVLVLVQLGSRLHVVRVPVAEVDKFREHVNSANV